MMTHLRIRRGLLPVALSCVASMAVGCASRTARRAQSNATAERPNVVVIMLDDHSTDVFGAYGNALAETPNLDRLAREGVRFDHAYANQPICTPSRQSLLTGVYPAATGVGLLQTRLSDATVTVPERLAPRGYRTAAIGKMHFNGPSGHGFDRVIEKGAHAKWLAAHPPAPIAEGLRTRGPWRPFKDPARVWLNADVLPLAEHVDDTASAFFVRHALDFVAGRGRDGALAPDAAKPFLLWLSLYQPHAPFEFPVEWAGRFDPALMPVPPVAEGDEAQIPNVFRGLTEADKRGIAAAYYTSLSFGDAMIGRFLDGLRALGRDRDTVILYLSDHGYHLGHHGRFEKHSFYERAVKTPLVIAWPGRLPGGSVVPALVELVDVTATILDVAGVHDAVGAGRSLLPLAQGSVPELRKAAVSTYGHDETAMIRTARWKLVYGRGQRVRDDGYQTSAPPPGRQVELYDCLADPEETHDVAHDERLRGVRESLLDDLHARLRETWPADLPPPPGTSREDDLDLMVQPPERLRAPVQSTAASSSPVNARPLP